jgi:hypothetical protein
MGNGQALFLQTLGVTDKDEPMTTMGDETAIEVALIVGQSDDDPSLLQPIAGCRYVGLWLFDNDQWQLQRSALLNLPGKRVVPARSRPEIPR